MTKLHRNNLLQAFFKTLGRLAAAAAAAGAFSAALAQNALAQNALAYQTAGDNAPASAVTVEFFTSQACSSCIPAAEYFRRLAARNDIVALAWHVDYWNTLQTRSGRWVDPYSSKIYTARQRQYNVNLRKRNSVFTPQMVINGGAEAVGSEEETVGRLIEQASAGMEPVRVSAERAGDGGIRFAVGETGEGGNAYLVVFKKELKTDIKGGENYGRLYHGVNAVKRIQPLGAVRRVGASLSVAPPADGYGCALIVQEPEQGRIIAARYCPSQSQ